MPQNARLYTFPFLLLCLSHVLFAASFTMILPELPAYLTSLGGEAYKGLIIALFTLMAGISRPFSGKLTDTVGRMPVMVFGSVVCVICSALYPLLTTVAGFLLLRFFHGFSTGFKPTAAVAYVADIVPDERRGEAMGILGIAMNSGASISPPFGSYLADNFSIEFMFYGSSFFAFLSILILFRLKETLKNKRPFKFRLLKISKEDIFDKSAIPPAIVTVFLYFCYGVILTIVPDQSVYIGMSNKGLFLMSLTAFSLISRLVAGKVSDRLGRVVVIKVSLVMVVISLVWMGYSTTPFALMASSGMLGFSVGMAAPAVFAWTIDRSAEQSRGRAVATVYIALEAGIGGGALLSAWIYANDPQKFALTFMVTAGITLLGFLYLVFRRIKS